MTQPDWEKVSEIFAEAVELPPDERTAFLDIHCGEDVKLRSEVESLLAADQQKGDFIAQPIVGDIAAGYRHPESFKAGEILVHYRIEGPIGFGGMGEVYRATDTKLNRQVALKILPTQFVHDPAFVRRFRNEALAAATLNHPNVATIYSVEEFDGRPFITMELVEGKTLRDLIPSDGVTLDKFLGWFLPVADALAHAHDHGITHRDIKPGNIMISDAGTPKVLDFGLAQMDPLVTSQTKTLEDITAPGQVIGTPSYMSPEQAEGRDVDYRTDIFSLGIVMYEALCGTRPFAGETYADVVRQIISTDPKPVTTGRHEIPNAVTHMIRRCLAKSPSARFTSMHEVRSIIEAVRLRSVEPASVDSFVRRFYREASGSSRRWLAAAGVLTLLLSFGAWYFFSARSQSPAISIERLNMRRLSQSNNVALATISPDGRSVAYVTYDENDERSLWLRRVKDANAIRIVPQQQVHYWDISFSPDSENVFFITAPRFGIHGTLYRVSSLGGPARKVVDKVNHLGNLSPDGKRVLFVRYGDPAPATSVNVTDSKLISANAEDGSGEQVLKTLLGESIVRKARFSSDGQSIFYIKRDLDEAEYWSIVQMNIQSGNERTLVRQRERIDVIAPLAEDKGLLVNAVDGASSRRQLFFVSVPGGRISRVTNDLNNYIGVSIDRDGSNIVAVQRTDESRVWVGSSGDLKTMTPLTREPLGHDTVDWTPDGRVVFDVVESSRLSIWIADADGKNAVQLSPPDSDNSEPRVSGDGRFIVFTSRRAGFNQVWRMNIDGSNPVLLADVPGITQDPQFAADGQTVVFRRYYEGSAPMAQVPVEGGVVSGLDYLPKAFVYFWAMSPDARYIAYTSGGEQSEAIKVVVRPVDSEQPSAELNIRPAWFLKWAPDGKSLIYQESRQGENLAAKVFQAFPNGGEPKVFMTAEPDNILDLTFSRDRTRFAAVRLKVVTDAVILTKQ